MATPERRSDEDAHQRRGDRLIGIQYLRALAALQVVFYHVTLAWGRPLTLGGFGVPLFFVISGFIMVVVTRHSPHPARFMAQRIGRIVPLYWIATTAAAVLAARLGALDLRHLAASYLFLPYGGPGGDPHLFPVLSVGWTLNYEMLFYGLFAASLWLPRRVRLVTLTATFVALVLAGYVLRPLAGAAAFWTDPVILQFVIGAWLGWWWTARRSLLWPILAWAIGAVLLVVPAPGYFTGGLFGALRAVLILLPALMLERRGAFRKPVRPLQLLGDASYSLYLWHLIPVTLLSLLLRRLGAPAWPILPLGIATAVVAGMASYLLMERPLLRALRGDPRVGSDPLTAGP